MRFVYTTVVDCATRDEADQVMAERLGPDEDYGFTYTVNFAYSHDTDSPAQPETFGKAQA